VSPESTKEADKALSKAGTNAIPVLLRMLREKESPVKRQIMRLLQRQRVVKIHYTPAERRNQAAYFAFLRLGKSGTGAELAVPQLIEIYEERISPFSRQCAATSLGAYGPAARSAIPVLLRGLSDTNVLVRCDTLNGLAHIRSEPEVVVPALAKALNDPVPKVRLFACMALSQQAAEAKPAASALVKALNDSDSSVRGMAADALRAIDPEAAARVGVK
jgi:HEAT repeat protein